MPFSTKRYIISKFVFWDRKKTTQNLPCDYHIAILFFLLASIERNVVGNKIRFYLILILKMLNAIQIDSIYKMILLN